MAPPPFKIWGDAVEYVNLTKLVSRGGAVVACRAHNPKVVGSSPAPATNKSLVLIDEIEFINSCLFNQNAV